MSNGDAVICGEHGQAIKTHTENIDTLFTKTSGIQEDLNELTGEFREFRGAVNTASTWGCARQNR